jgi:uncharacterized OB-fold protein
VTQTPEKVWPEVLYRTVPELTSLNTFFWTSGADGVLRILGCDDCGRLIHPPTPRCPFCLSKNVAPRPVSGRAVVETYTVNYQQWVPDQEPYAIGIVALEEDPSIRLTTNVVRCDPESVHIGLHVEVEFLPWNDLHLPIFHPAEPA